MSTPATAQHRTAHAEHGSPGGSHDRIMRQRTFLDANSGLNGNQAFTFVEAFTVRHCKRRTEALVANRDFEWLKPASLQEIVASRRRIRDMLVDILQRGVAAEVFRLPAIAGRSDARLVAMAILNQSIHVSSWFKPGGLWNEREVAALHAEMALRIAGG